MPNAFDTPVVPFADLPTQLLEASSRAINASAELYTEVLSTQAEATRAVLAAYSGLGTQAVQAGAETTERAEQVATRAVRRTGTAAKRATRRTAGATRKAVQAKPPVVEAPITGYDDLTAEEIVAKLPEQPQTSLAQIATYEQAHEKRSTVLQRVAALSGPEPAPGYDAMTADEVQKLVTGGSAALATAVRDYERRHKDRAGVLEAAARNTDES
jgi:hypothetical protein